LPTQVERRRSLAQPSNSGVIVREGMDALVACV